MCVLRSRVQIREYVSLRAGTLGREIGERGEWRRRRWHSTGTVVAGGGAGARRDSLEFGGSAGVLQDYTRKWGPSPLSPPLGAALGPVGLRPVSAAPGAETAKYRCTHTPTSHTSHSRQKCPPSIDANFQQYTHFTFR